MASGPHHEESELRNYQSRLESSFGLLEGPPTWKKKVVRLFS